MELSLSIASFPLDSETIQDMWELLKMSYRDYSKPLFEASWHLADVPGFAVLAYTENNELLGFAAAADLIGLDSYEWSAFVHPDYRRLTIGSALAGGVAYGLQQRQAVEGLAAFIEEEGAKDFIASLGYQLDFKEIELEAEPLADFELPGGLTIISYDGQIEKLENLMVAAFDEDVLPVVHYNIEKDDREVFIMKRDGELLASASLTKEEDESGLWITAFAVDPIEQGKGYGKAFLLWCRHYAMQQGKKRAVLEVETENDALTVYQKAGFNPVHTIEYWKKL
ncbi:GNAT family N-acetyltransferase [Planococcus halotolerans]|uniref:GNAT family N-acetyltransferase n=1 Tax=Planococcus halotolerans TaxID=2233542 RepID=UPI001092D054|nr:GNAT family N-acetyltransferase [Planococcus halotolerans]QHJ70406.1 GNAT family N-acetyltransferase [Planococcus halotolerans]